MIILKQVFKPFFKIILDSAEYFTLQNLTYILNVHQNFAIITRCSQLHQNKTAPWERFEWLDKGRPVMV